MIWWGGGRGGYRALSNWVSVAMVGEDDFGGGEV